MKLKKLKVTLALVLALGVFTPAMKADAIGFRGGSSFHSSSVRSTPSRSYTSNRSSSYSRSSSSSSSSKSSSSKSGMGSRFKSFFGGSKKAKATKSTSTGKFSGKTSTKSNSRTGSLSGRSTVRGKTYSGRSTTAHVNGRNVNVNHYYNAGYSPSGWFGYYHGFTTGMFMGSMMHPMGYAYPVGGHYVAYGASPIAWILDVIVLVILLIIIISIIVALRPSKTYTRRF